MNISNCASRIICALVSISVANSLCCAQNQILHYSETSGFDHNTRNQSLSMFQAIGASNNFAVVDDSSGSQFDSLASLQEFSVVVFSNTSGNNILSQTQRDNFEAYVDAGGSYLGIHAASDTYRHSFANGGSTGTWDWYAETVAGASVQQSPNHTSANHNNTMTHSQPGHPLLAGIPSPWNKTEEYYYWENGYLAPGFTELLQVGVTGGQSYDAARPMAHFRELPGGGRAFYTALGHSQSNFSNDQDFLQLIENAVVWAGFSSIGDFDSDGDWDVDDLNAMLAIGPVEGGVSATGNEPFDLTNDGLISNLDVDEWLQLAADENGLGSPYARGDANLDGMVDGTDFMFWSASKFTTSLSWDDGNFDGNAFVDGHDFLAWNANKSGSLSAPAAVPESSCRLTILLMLFIASPLFRLRR